MRNSEESSVYNQISKSLDAEADVEKVRKILADNFDIHPIKGDFAMEYEKDNSLNLICFDAFSQQTSHELWSLEFLDRFLAESAHEDCVLTTYACTGNLKKALRENGFKVIRRPSFKGYRNSTLALRGRFKSLEKLY